MPESVPTPPHDHRIPGGPLTPDAAVAELFCELVAVPSPSGRERALAELIREWLATAGVGAELDDAGERNGSDAGNLIATVPGAPGAPRLLFVAHVDTVESGTPAVRPIRGEDGVIRSAGETILGADNKSAVAAVMALCRRAARLPVDRRPTVVAAFTCREESGRMGAGLLDLESLAVDCAFSVDGSAPIGTVITRALGQSVFTVAIHGRAAHAAAAPEAGCSAIVVAAEIVAALGLGRRRGGGSASIAAIVGGAVADRLSPAALAALGVGGDADGWAAVSAALGATATNSVPDLAQLRGEVRGYSIAEMRETAAELRTVVGDVCERHGARWEWHDSERGVPPFPGAPGSRALALTRRAAADVPEVELVEIEAQATLEANHLAARVDVVALASGGRDPHQPSESITVDELGRLEALLAAIVERAAGSRGGLGI